MYRVFLAEDESVVREGLKNSIPWQQLGFEFVGDASDGELALQKGYTARRQHPAP